MMTRGEAMDESGPLRPLPERKEEREFLSRLEAIDEEFGRAFGPAGRAVKPAREIQSGPEPWRGFLDLSCL